MKKYRRGRSCNPLLTTCGFRHGGKVTIGYPVFLTSTSWLLRYYKFIIIISKISCNGVYNIFSMKKIKGIQKYADKWVVLNKQGSAVIKAGEDFNQVFKTLKGDKDKRVIFKVPSATSVYSP